jgi:Phage integrase family
MFDRQIATATVRVYLAAINNFHGENTVPIMTSNDLVYRALNGYKRLDLPEADKRLPITMDIMGLLKDRLCDSVTPDHDKALYWSAFTVAFFGFLRISEFASMRTANLDSPRVLQAIDFKMQENGLEIRLRGSKTDQLGHGYHLKITATGRSVCAVRAYRKYVAIRAPPRRLPPDPLHTFSNGRPLDRKLVDRLMKQLLADHPQKHHLNTHSFRIEAATTAADNNVPLACIQKAGRWKGERYISYIRNRVSIQGVQLYPRE